MKAQSIPVGSVFGRLTVAGIGSPYIPLNGKRYSTSECRCECGVVLDIRNCSLLNGRSGSCGCLNADGAADRATTHGLSGTPEYSSWQCLLIRTRNKNRESWKYYGERGITVCDRWRNSFENFLSDMGPKPTPRHTIDRINNNGNYEPGNCRWATRREQANNKRNNVRLTHNGVTRTQEEWAVIAGVNSSMLSKLIKRGGSVGDVLNQPLSKSAIHHE